MIDAYAAPPLVTLEDLQDAEFTGSGKFTEIDVAVACAIVRGACGWHIGPTVEVDLVLDSDGGRLLLLPSLHVNEVLSITDKDDAALTGWQWSGSGMLYREAGFPKGYRSVKVKLSTGLPKAPPDLMAVVADLARARGSVAAVPNGLRSKTVGEVRYEYLLPTDVKDDADPVKSYEHILWRYSLHVR